MYYSNLILRLEYKPTADLNSNAGEFVPGSYAFFLVFMVRDCHRPPLNARPPIHTYTPQVFVGLGAMSMFSAVFVDSLLTGRSEAERALELLQENWRKDLRNDISALMNCADVNESGVTLTDSIPISINSEPIHTHTLNCTW